MTPQRLDIHFALTWDGRWMVGSGRGTARADSLVQRRRLGKQDRRGVPFVPGAQIKGVLRHHCEMLAGALGLSAVSPHTTGQQPPVELLEHFRPLTRSGLVVDRLFGSRYQGECLFVDDALPRQAEDTGRVRLHSRTSIDRVVGTAREQTLFVSEVVESKGQSLVSRLQARHPAGVLTSPGDGPPLEYSLLVAGLLGLEALGGDRSTGLGRCQVAITNLLWQGQPLTAEEALASFQEADWKTLLELYREGT
jgi:CRISPR/Cas system CSM-associated protein Csm3 (group 7 of RAMP superfamily)